MDYYDETCSADGRETYTTTFPWVSRKRSSIVPGASQHPAVFSTSTTIHQDTLLSFASYVKTHNIPILPVTKPDIRSVLGQGASFLVNGAEVPEDYIDPATGALYPQGLVVALKRAVLGKASKDPVVDRIRVVFNELLTMQHPPLAAHPNIVNLLGVGFENEEPSETRIATPTLICECAELGNLAEVLETARKEERPLNFDQKISLCLDVAHGLEILHACDIVHGDVKCENVLIFEKDSDNAAEGSQELCCKLTDFGVSRLANGDLVLGGSRPWHAPECFRGAAFKLEEAKRTDMYSFGMLLWRVCLDGDPFNTLGEFPGPTVADKRQQRNEAIAAKKESDLLVKHVCDSLALSGNFTRPQLEILCEVIGLTLVKDSSRRELDVTRIIRLLTPNYWFEARHPIPPSRLPLDPDCHLLDLGKWYSEFESTSPLVQSLIVSQYEEYALSSSDVLMGDPGAKRSAAGYQLAVCYANGVGGSFDPDACLKWLNFAAQRGSQKAQEALPKIMEAFRVHPIVFTDPWGKFDDQDSMISSSSAVDSLSESMSVLDTDSRNSAPKVSKISFLNAAETCNYHAIELLLQSGTKPSTSEDGVSPLHFLSSWKLDKAEDLGRKLIQAGANISTVAKRGPTIGGNPLMWSVYGNHLEHSKILLRLGADPMAATEDGCDALSFAAKLHLVDHLRLLLDHTRPVQIRGHLRGLVEAAAGGDSRFTRIHRHGENWKTAPVKTLQLLRDWNTLFPDTDNFGALVVPALLSSLKTSYGRMNTDVQVAFIQKTMIDASDLKLLLRESVTTFNKELFDALLNYGVPIHGTYEGNKTLLHLCARIPDHSLAATAFAPRLLDLGVELDVKDKNGITPWMDAILERKWDLADLLMRKGAQPLVVDNEGFNILGLCINAINLGSIKYLMKYCAQKTKFHKDAFLVNKEKQISALQLASALTLPRAHGMKIEVLGTFLTILANFAQEPAQINFRSSGLLPDATALDIAASKGNVHAVKNLVKKGARLPDSKRMSRWSQAVLTSTDDYMTRMNLERCIFIIENWDDESKNTKKLADDWTNVRTIDESHVKSSWEIVIFDYEIREGLNED